MAKIQVMSDQLANQIAAGEVVERPASVIKELVENSIDAGASQILVEVQEAGIQSIQVTDNGIGMEVDDLAAAFLPHATSKIFNVQDLFNIQSLGFRGEALASIASVSRVYLQSMVEGQNKGHFIQVAGSKIKDQGVAQAKPGTLIRVEDLFYNTPARLKHLKSLRTEMRHILNFMQDIALSYPHIRFVLESQGQVVFRTVGNGDLQQAIASVYQPAIARELLPIEAQDMDFEIKGYLSKPTLTRTSKDFIHWIINGRAVRSISLDRVLIQAYGRQLMIGRYPIAVIHIHLDPQLVDVNVHPTKQTVRLSKEEELAHLLQAAIQKFLSEINPIPEADVELISKNSNMESGQVKVDPLPLNLQSQPVVMETEASYQSQKPLFTESSLNDGPTNELNSGDENFKKKPTSNKPLIDFANLRYVGQIHGTYLIAESENGFYLIDQHAAQEKIRYEAFMADDQTEFVQQTLLLPIVFQMSASEFQAVQESRKDLERLGIHLTPFGPQSFQLESYPNWIEESAIEKTVRDTLQLVIDQPNLTIPQIKEKSIIMKSCRGAIKANHRLSPDQAQSLIQDMAELADPYHCPHGRPVFVEFTTQTLEKLFKRIQDAHQAGARAY
ncbi:DNA mismatch repair endonuclease MutL [Hutsoniella sourekii]|uniref:DNA mismatch repair endonuclease MutL n=1 Tax=Hutsoniella sourekii TaxID=87650 RepID=UPI000484A798|nr:DNA mismatch repair endonuclease MutL [Hutsoniella sourekii]